MSWFTWSKNLLMSISTTHSFPSWIYFWAALIASCAPPVIAVSLQTLCHAAVGTNARSIDPTLILLAGVDASFDFAFNDYLHIASLSAAPQPSATARNAQNPDLVHFRIGNFLTSSVIIVSPVSGNRLRPHRKTHGHAGLQLQASK